MGLPSRSRGWRRRIFFPSWLACFCDATTLPTTLAMITIFRPQKAQKAQKIFCLLWLFPLHVIDDSDDRRFRRNLFRFECVRGLASTAYINRFAGTGTDGVDRDNSRTVGKAADQ